MANTKKEEAAEEKAEAKKEDPKEKYKKTIVEVALVIGLCLIAVIYLILGLTLPDGFALYWPLLFIGLLPCGLSQTILYKNALYFPIWVFALFAFLLCGITLDLGFHPYWAILLIIPVYYCLVWGIQKIKIAKKDLPKIDK